MRATVKVIVKDGKIYIEYPNIGQKCFEIGRRIRETLKSLLDISSEEVIPLQKTNIIAQKQKKIEMV